MDQSDAMPQSTRIQPQRLRWFSVIVAITANALLFYVLALARAKPSLPAIGEHDIMRVIAIDLSAPRDVERHSRDLTRDTMRANRQEALAVSVEPAVDMTPSFLPRLSDWIGDISPDLTGLPVALPGLSDLRPTDSAPVPELGEGLLILRVDRIPSKIAGAPPRYPAWARRAGLEATVTLRFVVTAEGAVQDINIHNLEGDERFGDEAVKAVAAWRFEPALKAGKRVACWCFQKVSFKLH
jgi:protein TonB